MAVKRYRVKQNYPFGGHLTEAADGAWVEYEDYAALEAKAYKAGTAAGELQMRVNQLQAECERLRGEIKNLTEELYSEG